MRNRSRQSALVRYRVIARAILASVFLLAACYKFSSMPGFARLLGTFPVLRSTHPAILGLIGGIIAAVELLLALYLVFGKCPSTAAMYACGILILFTVAGIMQQDAIGCGCNWAIPGLSTKSASGLLLRNAALFAIALSIVASTRMQEGHTHSGADHEE